MVRTVAIAALVLSTAAGCNKKKDDAPAPADPAPTPAPAPAPTTSDAAAAAAATCPADGDLIALLTRAWKPKPTQKIGKPSCAGGTFPEPALAVSSWILPVDTDKGGPGLFDYRLELIAPDGTTLASFDEPHADDPREWLNGHEPELAVADLNGDGVGEILASYDWIGREDTESSSTDVYLRDGDELVEAGHIETRRVDPQLGDGGDDSSNNPWAVECTAEMKLTAPDARGQRAIELTWTVREGAKAKGTCPTGVHRYQLDGDKLTERPAN
jgi:hypothetical protein